MLRVNDTTVESPDIEATAANLRTRFELVDVLWSRPEGIQDDLRRVRANPFILEDAKITSPNNIGLVRFAPEDDRKASIKFLLAEIVVDGPMIPTNCYEI